MSTEVLSCCKRLFILCKLAAYKPGCYWYGDGNPSGHETAAMLEAARGIVEDEDGDLSFDEWNYRAGQNNVIIRTDGTVAPCFPMYSATFDWDNIVTSGLTTTN